MSAIDDMYGQEFRSLPELLPAAWEKGCVRARDGAELHYIRTGGGNPPLVLLHGVQAAGPTWLRTAQALAKAYDVVMPDARGHGSSSRIVGPFDAETLADDVVALLDTLAIERPDVLGHSMGADTAGRLAVRVLARNLVLVDPALHHGGPMMALDMDNPPPWMASVFATLRALGTQPYAERLRSARSLLPPGTPPLAEADYVASSLMRLSATFRGADA